jgi:mono/diheme cytochrome c family protein
MIMPDASLSNVEVESVIDYITARSVSVVDAEPEMPANVTAASTSPDAIETPDNDADQIARGRHLFEGTLDFKNRGPTCNACHHVSDEAVLGGGALAADLTTVFSRMSAAGIRAIVGQAPFPAMQVAYAGKPLTESEITDLVAYLRHANAEPSTQTPKNYGVRLFVSGVVGSAALFGFCGLVWRGRKRGSVYQDIYDRQLKSE